MVVVCCRAKGFTLLEMLVTLLIVGLATSLMAQAMGQLARVERMLEEGGSARQELMVRREWLRGLLASASPEQVSVERQFVGQSERLQLRSPQALELNFSATTGVKLEQQRAGEYAELRLTPAWQPGEETKRPAVTLFRWTEQGAPPFRLAYLDSEGRWHTEWPAPGTNPEKPRRLPVMVRLDLAEEVGGPMWVKVAASDSPRPSLAFWMNQ